MSTPLFTSAAILSFPHLWEPYAGKPRWTPRYGTDFLFTIGDPFLDDIARLVQEAISKKWPAGPPPDLKTPISYGTIRYPQDPFMEDKVILSAYRAQEDGAPLVTDRVNTPILDRGCMYYGCIVQGLIDIYAYDSGNQGVTAGLHGVRRLGDGTRLKGVDSKAMFGNEAAPAVGADPANYAGGYDFTGTIPPLDFT